MELRAYLAELSPAEREKLASQCDTSAGHLKNVSLGWRTCSVPLAIAIEKATGGKVRCEELCEGVDWRYLRRRA